jgi:hypothetical protein
MASRNEPDQPLSPQQLLVEQAQDLLDQSKQVLEDLKSLLGVEIHGPTN